MPCLTMCVLALVLAPVASQDLFLEADSLKHEQRDGKHGLKMHHMAEPGDVLEGDWTEKELPSKWQPTELGGYWINVTKYKSPVINLLTGGGIFSLNPVTPMPFPKGDYSILHVEFQMVDQNGKQTSLAEVYNHHWLIGMNNGFDVLSWCEGNVFFGAGAEMRGTPTIFPDGYAAKRIGASGHCGGNLHFIRTEDLKTSWDGFNNPNGSIGAATKNCIECGWAPGRAVSCSEKDDGGFACCVQGSRCPVNHPEDRTKKGYHLEYEVRWTRDLTQSLRYTSAKETRMGVFDISGGSVEWNVGPNLDSPRHHQVCTDKICNITNELVVGKQTAFGHGICSGTMIWSYMHQHTGAINGTMSVNGKFHCASIAHAGTDPNNAPGNEKGYVVHFEHCVNIETKKNGIRLNKGDVLTLTGLYDVDVASTRNLPMPGGKHGGVMGLFFFYMDCDPGTFNMEYVCREAMCIPIGPGRGDYKTLDACQQACMPPRTSQIV